MSQVYTRRTRIQASAQEVFSWHEQPQALDRLIPPWENVRIIERPANLKPGSRAVLDIGIGVLRKRWVAEHREYRHGKQFQDVQIAGPFASWAHTHSVHPEGSNSCVLEDRIEYRLPLGRLGSWLAGGMVDKSIDRSFAYRHRTTAADVVSKQRGSTMKVAITGASGLIGSSLAPYLATRGHAPLRVVRSQSTSSANEICWNPDLNQIDAAALEGVDAVVHLAGENISGRWTATKKQRIKQSRLRGTQLLAETLTKLDTPPRVLVAASAIGYYGDRGEQLVDETSEPGSGFLAEVTRDWEAATQVAAERGIRVVCLRFGVVLSPRGGALASMLTPFKLGLGGNIGSGKQVMSWIAIDDALGVIEHALSHDELSGPVNAVAPRPVSNREFTKTLGRVLGRPTLIPMPALAARLAFGEMADELLLASTNVQPSRLTQSGYTFRHPTLEPALRHLLGN